MLYRIGADAVLLLHLSFILFVLFGGLLVAWRRGFLLLHLPAVAWGIYIELSGGACPLIAKRRPGNGRAGLRAISTGRAADCRS